MTETNTNKPILAEGLVGTAAAAAAAGVTRAYVQRLARAGRIPAQKLGPKAWVVSLPGLLALVESNRAIGNLKHRRHNVPQG